MAKLVVPLGKLDSVTFDQLLEAQNPFHQRRPCFDLRGCTFISPAGLVQLAAACHAIAQDGRRAIIRLDDLDVRTYLLRSQFVQVVRAVADFDPEIPDIMAGYFGYFKGNNPLLVEVTEITTGAELPDLLDRILHALRYRLKYPKNEAFDIVTAVSEICQNTVEHAEGAAGFLAMQVYGKGDQRFLEIGVADYGQGLAATLGRNRHLKVPDSDIEAIFIATELGTSQHDDPTRGTGLYHLLEKAYQHGGSVQIRSGTGKVRFRMDRKRGWRFKVSHMPGVQVALSLPQKDYDA